MDNKVIIMNKKIFDAGGELIYETKIYAIHGKNFIKYNYLKKY